MTLTGEVCLLFLLGWLVGTVAYGVVHLAHLTRTLDRVEYHLATLAAAATDHPPARSRRDPRPPTSPALQGEEG